MKIKSNMFGLFMCLKLIPSYFIIIALCFALVIGGDHINYIVENTLTVVLAFYAICYLCSILILAFKTNIYIHRADGTVNKEIYSHHYVYQDEEYGWYLAHDKKVTNVSINKHLATLNNVLVFILYKLDKLVLKISILDIYNLITRKK